MYKISEVFTPRSSKVNLRIYVPRLDLERALMRAVHGSMHALLFGESGNGKSWMYKKVLEQNNILYEVVNCANASRLKSLTSAIAAKLVPPGTVQKTGYTENKEASLKALVADAKIIHQSQYKVHITEVFEDALASFRKQNSQHGPAVVVIDNLESIFANSERMDELADLIILLDDSQYAQYDVKFLIVGVPNGVLEYFAKTKNLESVANRIEELPKVGGLTAAMVKTLVKTGFNELLQFNLELDVVEQIANHVHHITMGVAQRVQEYCEKLAYQIDDAKGIFRPELLENADREWLRQGMRQGYTVVESHLNSKRTTIARRNQVIYCIGKIKTHQIDSNKIYERLCEEFSDTVSETNMGIGSILSELASGDSPLLRKNPRTNEYRVVDPRYIMCIRIMLRKDKVSNSVEKLSFGL